MAGGLSHGVALPNPCRSAEGLLQAGKISCTAFHRTGIPKKDLFDSTLVKRFRDGMQELEKKAQYRNDEINQFTSAGVTI